MYPGYKARRKEFKDLFGSISPGSRFVVDYSCAYHKDILHQGRIYVTTTSCSFYSYIFGFENKVTIPWSEVVTVTKEKTAIFIPNAIQISTADSKFFFASFVDRDSSHMMLTRLWQAVAGDNPLSDEDVDQIIACEYGEGDEADIDNSLNDDEDIAAHDISVSDKEQNNNNSNSKAVSLAQWLRDCDGDVVTDKTFARSKAELFRLVYSNDNFYFNFQKERGTTELDIGDWEEGEAGVKEREVSYNMELNNPVGPKKCQVKESQVLRDVDGDKMLTVDTVADNSGVPYADSFSVLTHNCLLDTGPDSSRLIAKVEIKFKKELWGFLKDKIQTNAWAGIKDYYSSLSNALEMYSEAEPQQARLQTKIRTRQSVTDTSGTSSVFRPWLVATIMIILMVTSLINTFILYRLSELSGTPPPLPPIEHTPLPPDLPTDQEGWVRLVTRQAEIHEARTRILKHRLMTAAQHIANAEASLASIGELLDQWKPFDWLDQDMNYCDDGNKICDKSKMKNDEL